MSCLGNLDNGRSRSHQGRHIGRRFTRDERALFTKDERGATTHRCKYSRTGSPKRREPTASLSNFQTHPFSVRLSERRPMNSTMKGFSQHSRGCLRPRRGFPWRWCRLLPASRLRSRRIEGIFDGLACVESHCLAGCDFDVLSGLWVPPACGARRHIENAEAGDTDRLAGQEGIKEAVSCRRRRSFGRFRSARSEAASAARKMCLGRPRIRRRLKSTNCPGIQCHGKRDHLGETKSHGTPRAALSPCRGC